MGPKNVFSYCFGCKNLEISSIVAIFAASTVDTFTYIIINIELMKMKKTPLLVASVMLSAFVCCQPVSEKNSLEQQVDELYNRMSLEERVAQIYSVRPSEVMEDGKVSREKMRRVLPYGVGSGYSKTC